MRGWKKGASSITSYILIKPSPGIKNDDDVSPRVVGEGMKRGGRICTLASQVDDVGIIVEVGNDDGGSNIKLYVGQGRAQITRIPHIELSVALSGESFHLNVKNLHITK